MKEIRLNVPQGIGDIIWIYQKFAPHVDRIHFNVCHVSGHDNVIQGRAEPFLKLLPKVGDIGKTIVEEAAYAQLAAGRFKVRTILGNSENGCALNYACNKPLEEGIRLEKIDAEAVEIDVLIKEKSTRSPYRRYVALYVSGGTLQDHPKRLGCWSVEGWLSFVEQLTDRASEKLPLIILGASYDKDVAFALSLHLSKRGFKNKVLIDRPAAQVVALLKNAEFLIGYQSGLCIIADLLDVRQVMLYYPFLNLLRHSWPKLRNIQARIYQSAVFSDGPDIVAQNTIPW